jgi:glutamate-1-semialdehyde 2,1-aminomutase
MYGHNNAADLPEGFPQFFKRGHGCRVWDVDGKEYVDLMCSWGPIVLGYQHPGVEAAVAKQLKEGDVFDGPTARMVELAELLVDTVAHADWAMFCKNGTDAMSLAVLIARAATGRRKVLMARGSYHGIGAWSSGGFPGVTPEEAANTLFVEYNDLASVEAAAHQAGGDLAAIVATPIRHDLRKDLEPVQPEYAQGLRAICDRAGAVLILDDIRCGLRIDIAGSWEPLGVRPDLSAWSKAIANGHPLACVLGRDSLADAAKAVRVTGSFWFAAVPMAASIATLQALRQADGVATMAAAGERLCSGLREQARGHGLNVKITGPPQLPFMSFVGDKDQDLANFWTGECVRRGVYLHPFHNWFLSTAHTASDIDRALETTDEAFAVVARALAA